MPLPRPARATAPAKRTPADQRAAPSSQTGIATALPMMLRALGGAVGVALLGEYRARHTACGLVAALRSATDKRHAAR